MKAEVILRHEHYKRGNIGKKKKKQQQQFMEKWQIIQMYLMV